MSKLQELINELCPDGVEYKKLSDITNLTAGERITKAMMSDNYAYPVMGGGVIPTGRYEKYNREKCITISRAGSAGSVNWHSGRIWATDVCFTATQRTGGPNIKFVYYCVESKESELKKQIYGGNLPKLNKEYLWGLPIPVPPLPIQEEVVRILDKMTDYVTELKAELKARKIQYENYRDDLLAFDSSAFKEKMQELVNELCPNGVEYISLKNKEIFNFRYGKGNKIPVDTGGKYNVYGANGIVSHIDEFNCEDVSIIGHIGSVGEVHRSKEKCYVTYNGTIAEVVDKKVLNTQYFYYVLCTLNLPSYKKGSQPFLSVSDFNNVSIPIPPLPVQEEIVRILDKFSSICNDISTGLPAEIEARQKQYEYYRDKLLSFQKLENEEC